MRNPNNKLPHLGLVEGYVVVDLEDLVLVHGEQVVLQLVLAPVLKVTVQAAEHLGRWRKLRIGSQESRMVCQRPNQSSKLETL